jgi:hypothetical protein
MPQRLLQFVPPGGFQGFAQQSLAAQNVVRQNPGARAVSRVRRKKRAKVAKASRSRNRTKKRAHLIKGSKAAKAYMAKIRRKKK